MIHGFPCGTSERDDVEMQRAARRRACSRRDSGVAGDLETGPPGVVSDGWSLRAEPPTSFPLLQQFSYV